MTRFGVMKHLKLLEEAGLVVARRRGREKLHFLNAVPIRLVHERWIDKYYRTVGRRPERPQAPIGEHHGEGLRDLHPFHAGAPLGGHHRSGDQEQVQLRRPGRVGVDPRGSPRDRAAPAADLQLAEGEILEVDPPRRLVHTMTALWSDDVKREGSSRVTWDIEPVGDSCHLTVTHDQLRDGAHDEIYGGWPMILSGLKTWLETGELLTTPGSLMYG